MLFKGSRGATDTSELGKLNYALDNRVTEGVYKVTEMN